MLNSLNCDKFFNMTSNIAVPFESCQIISRLRQEARVGKMKKGKVNKKRLFSFFFYFFIFHNLFRIAIAILELMRYTFYFGNGSRERGTERFILRKNR